MILGVDYKIREDKVKGEDGTIPIELTSGPYADIIYRYITVSIVEKEEQAVVKFDYEIIYSDLFTEEELRKDQKFVAHIGLVLNALILDTFDTQEALDSAD